MKDLLGILLAVSFSTPIWSNSAAQPTPVANESASAVLASAHGIVSHRISGCDYFLVQTGAGYDLLEWYGGHDPDKGDTIVGGFEAYGFHDVIDETADESIHIYTDNYWLSKSSALEKLIDKCH
jgi:hypothetical protein